VLSRWYSPEQYADLGLFFISVGVLSAVGTLKLDQALLLPKAFNQSAGLVQFALNSLLITLVLASPVVFWFSGQQLLLTILILLGGLTSGMALLFIQLSNRTEKSNVIAVHKVLLGLGVSGFQLLFSRLLNGLVLGKVFGDLIAVAPYIRVFSKRLSAVKTMAFDAVWREYKAIPLFLLPHTVLVLVANRLPLMVLSYQDEMGIGGEYENVFRIGLALFTLLSQSVYLTFSKEYVVKRGSDEAVYGFIRQHFVAFFKWVALPSIPLIGVMYLVFPSVLGPQWENSGLIALLISPMLLSGLFSAPFVYMLLYEQKLGWLFGAEAIITLLKALGLFVGLSWSPLWGVGMFSLAGTIGNVVMSGYMLRMAKGVH
jgi:O-antigen/teichoic acid export membrane protein